MNLSRSFVVNRTEWSAVAVATMALFVAALFFGGASRLHELRLAGVELVALPLAVLTIGRLIEHAPRPSRLSLWILTATAALPLAQLLPLPMAIWSSLPGRNEPALALELAGLQPSWLPMSSTPDRTWRSFLAVIPPVAMFLGFGLCTAVWRLRMIHLLLGFVVISIVVGTAQLASGGAQFYPWATTTVGTVVGFFANRNHLATLCLLSLPFASVIGARILRTRDRSGRFVLWLSMLFVTLVVLSLGVIRSRMGIALAAPTLALSLIAAWIASGGGRPKPLLLGLVGGVAVAVSALLIFALAPLIARFDTTAAREGRFENWPIVADAAQAYLPLGSGLGSFDTVYRSVEPLERLDATFFNQAHNEYLEIWLETGWIGVILVFAFLVWFSIRGWQAWRAPPGRERDLQRAATIAIGVVLAHSAVDYPLRTETIAVIFALCCAIVDRAAFSDDVLSGVRRHNDAIS